MTQTRRIHDMSKTKHVIVTRAGKWLRKKPSFFKNLKNMKSPKFRFFYFLVKFYTNHIKFHILIFICEFCYILQNML